MTRLLTSMLLGLALAALPACGGDDDGGSDGSDDIDAGDGDTADAADDGPDAALPDAFAPPTAEEFCTDYEAECGFGGDGDHADMEACTAAFDGYDDGQVTCVVNHLGLASLEEPGSADHDSHCGHATGDPPCN